MKEKGKVVEGIWSGPAPICPLCHQRQDIHHNALSCMQRQIDGMAESINKMREVITANVLVITTLDQRIALLSADLDDERDRAEKRVALSESG
ncbi:MAG: hypothetical protein WC551_07890 [Patescibacteria group bacterium]